MIDISYERSVKLVECLQKIEEIVNLRPHNWLIYSTEAGKSAEKNGEEEVVPYLLKSVFHLREEAALLVLKLLVALFADGTENVSI